MLTLYVGNKNYSSWSMRPWVLMKNAGIAFAEKVVLFDSFDANSNFKAQIQKVTPVGKVPVLVDQELAIWDTLAIAEYLAETHPQLKLWPESTAQRAHARSICAEMHSGFSALRSACPMNIEAALPSIGALVLRDQAAVRADKARIENIWTSLLSEHGGPFLFGSRFSIADAFFAPVCMRFKTYALSTNSQVLGYIATISQAEGVKQWIADALQEDHFKAFEEPYRLTR